MSKNHHVGSKMVKWPWLLGVIVIIVIGSRKASGDVPQLFIDNKLESVQTYDIDRWVITDNYNQLYKLDFSNEFSERLELTSRFSLEIVDIIKSEDVDTKTLIPEIEISLINPIWRAKIFGRDTIEYTNEFNKDRLDSIEGELDFSFYPNYFPPIGGKVSKSIDYQKNLEDIVMDKIDANSSYNFGSVLFFDGAIKLEQRDDKIIDNNDLDSTTWEINGSYSQALSPALKADLESHLKSEKTDTLNNLSEVISRTHLRSLENKAKFTLVGFPRIDSALEFNWLKESVEPKTENSGSFSFTLIQDVLELGSFKENFQYKWKELDSLTDEGDEKEIILKLEYSGMPNKWLNLTTSYSLDLFDKDYLNPASGESTNTSTFDFAATFTPFSDAEIKSTYNRSGTYSEGKITSVRGFLLEGVIKGEYLNIPNLTFEPSIEFTSDSDQIEGNTDWERTVTLDFNYVFSLPKGFNLELNPSYSWENVDYVTYPVSIGLDYTFSVTTYIFGDQMKMQLSGGYSNIFGDPQVGGDWKVAKNLLIQIMKEITGNISSKIIYEYDAPDAPEDPNNDSTEVSLSYAFKGALLYLTYNNVRSFGQAKNDERTYKAEFLMTF